MPTRRGKRAPRSALRVGGEEFAVVGVALPRTEGLLSPAERMIVELLAHGFSNAEIAAARGTSVRTVANQLQAVYRKLGVSSRFELIARYGASRGAT